MKAPKRLLLLIVFVASAGTGCQTFTLTKEQFEKQQRGQAVNPEIGALVGAAASIGYLGAMIGAAAAGVK